MQPKVAPLETDKLQVQMLANQPFSVRRAQGAVSRIVPDRRRHKRISVTLLGRFMRESKEEHACKLIDISAGGAAITSAIKVPVGERVLAYFDHIGGIEGTVVREFANGFAFRINATKHKQEKLVAQLTWLANRSELPDPVGRRHERITPKNGDCVLQLAEGITINCRVLDVSISGASVATPARPEIGTDVVLGKLRARVMRHHANGFGVQFIDTQNTIALRRYFG